MRSVAAAVALALAGLALLVAALVHDPGVSLPHVSVVQARVVLPQGGLRFGDVVRPQLDVLVPGRSVDPASVSVRTEFAPYRPVVPVRVDTLRDGGTTLLRYRYELDCLEAGCVPASAARFLFRPARVAYRTRNGAARTLEVGWPALSVAPRPKPPMFSPWETGLSALPAPSYRVPPRLVAVLALLLALVALAGAGLVVRAALRARADGKTPGSLLERALNAVRRAAADGDVDERRRALDLLCLALRERADGAYHEARRLAWSRSAPGALAMDDLAERAERG